MLAHFEGYLLPRNHQSISGNQNRTDDNVALKQFRIEEKALKVLQKCEGNSAKEQGPYPSSTGSAEKPEGSGEPKTVSKTVSDKVEKSGGAAGPDGNREAMSKNAPVSTSMGTDTSAASVTLQLDGNEAADISKMSIAQLHVELRRLMRLRKTIKTAIMDWLAAFRAREGKRYCPNTTSTACRRF